MANSDDLDAQFSKERTKPQDPDKKDNFVSKTAQNSFSPDDDEAVESIEELTALERKLVRKIDWRLCTIAGILCSLNLLDSGIISSASVTTIFEDLGFGVGNRYSVSILVYTVASVAFQLPATLLVRYLGPRIMFGGITVMFGVITMVSIIPSDLVA
jgi:hypothetical protein